jgi:hypothetical protein
MKNIKNIKDWLNEDWDDNNPNAPWNQEDREVIEDSKISYPESQQKFSNVYVIPAHQALLKDKDGSFWYGELWGEYPDDYLTYYNRGDPDEDSEFTDESWNNVATDLIKDDRYIKTLEEYENGEGDEDILLLKIDTPEIKEFILDKLETILTKPAKRSNNDIRDIKNAIGILHKYRI